MRSDEVMLGFSEPFWIASTSFHIMGVIFGATRIITTVTRTTELAFQMIQKYKVTYMFCGVPFLKQLLENEAINLYDLKTLRHCLCSGSVPPPGLLTKFNRYFPDGQAYNRIGMTETGGAYAVCPTKLDEDISVGYLTYGLHAKIIDENGNHCGPNERGEVYLKPRFSMLGYYNNPVATNEVFDAEGFFKTGDVAYFDGKTNKLWIVDRAKDIIKYNYFQLSPSQIETVVRQSTEIADACAVGIPDKLSLELPAVAVILKTGSKITEEEIYALVAGTIKLRMNLS